MKTTEALKVAWGNVVVSRQRSLALPAPGTVSDNVVRACNMEVAIQMGNICALLGITEDTMATWCILPDDQLASAYASALGANAQDKAKQWRCTTAVAEKIVGDFVGQYIAVLNRFFSLVQSPSGLAKTTDDVIGKLRELHQTHVSSVLFARLIQSNALGSHVTTAQRYFCIMFDRLIDALAGRACQVLGFDLSSLGLMLDSNHPEKDLIPAMNRAAEKIAQGNAQAALSIAQAFQVYACELADTAQEGLASITQASKGWLKVPQWADRSSGSSA